MIRLLVGLGNPGQQYAKTRHNAGFLFLEALADELGGVWINEPKFQGLFSACDIAGRKVMLLKPETFMNRSGEAVGKIARFYKLAPEEILVIHDDLDFDAGIVKLKKEGGHAGHNGLKDIIAHLGSKDFYRLRIGIGRPAAGRSIVDFVLSPPSKNERDLIVSSFCLSRSFINEIVTGDIATVMNKLHAC
ncbi:peptidyl-tRNA hydrolase [Candidatus Methylobacter favarea]|uniref:Peptidyl-tRNA hydrolase n=1 Tax=Candidatus Methylobacter favarea TaxID=2707345 RepID=A0A8S0WH56_9GAMM|nr:aminoacyl-tRNA hydrolase [Candidatus Methylobacter favarea]CAA9889569.1 peptidyl-tRNA hydrolase [Candidatus Methylobacter favarea]